MDNLVASYSRPNEVDLMSAYMPFWCFLTFHKWRFYPWKGKDVCVRAGCGEIRPHQKGTQVAESK